MITTSTGAKKIENTDNWREIFDAHNDSVDAEDKLAQDTAPIVNGNKSTTGASAGEYVLVRNSSITGITDGAYKAAQAIPANTAIDSTYLTAITGGIANDLNSNISTLDGKIDALLVRETSSPAFSNGVATVNAKSGYYLIACNACRNDANYPIDSITEKTNGDYLIKSSSGVTANISIAKYWAKI